MSVLQKLFQKKSTEKKPWFCRKPRPAAVIELPTKDEKPREEPSVFLGAMPPPYLRLVLFQEEASERRLLFDSKSFEPQKGQNNCCKSNCDSPQSSACSRERSASLNTTRPLQHVYVRGPQDSDVLSEMLFGAVGLASRASSLKIHIMRNPQRLMLSRVFCVESAKETGSLERGLDNQRPTSSRRKAKTLPVPTPEPPPQPSPMSPYQSLASSFTSKIARSDSSNSLMSLIGASLGNNGSLGSRTNPNQILSNKAHSLPPARQASRDSFTLTQEPHSGILSRRTKVKIGFAVIFQPEPSDSRISFSEFQQFFFEHFPLVESYVTFLKEQVENALNNFKKGGRAEFFENMMEALNVFTSRIQSVYSTPRFSRPVWPTLMTQTENGLPWRGDDVTVKCFISELARMVNQHNTKQKNFFMTGLITSALTHHLGWVNTTISGAENDGESRLMSYNPLWAQLGDLYGAVGTPTKVAKTVVVGEIHEVVSTIISILSYFIRCSAVNEVVKVPDDFTPQAFCKNNTSLKFSYVASDLEFSDYVLIDMDDRDIEKPIMHDSDCKTVTATTDSNPKESFLKKKLCRKTKSKPIDVAKEQNSVDQRGSATSGGSVLCRSRSSPATSMKPQLYRQQSGNFDCASPRVRTNSNEGFAKPRSSQSRRTSRNAAQSTSFSASTKSIPDDVTLDVAKLSKSSVKTDRHANDEKGSNENMSTPKSDLNTSLLPVPRLRTHKRVSSEPFTVSSLQNENNSSTLSKTRSTYFRTPIRQETFVANLEPRIINVAPLQRAAQPIVAHSPLTKNSTSIMGFKMNEKGHSETKLKSTPKKMDFGKKSQSTQSREINANNKSDSGAYDNENASPTKTTPKTAPVASSSSRFHFNEEKNRRSISTGSAVRRNSSGKQKIAARRRHLPDPLKIESGHNHPLPPLTRIPSISLEHDEFNQYFSEDDKDGVTFFVGMDSGDQPTVSDGHSTITKTTSESALDNNHDRSNNEKAFDNSLCDVTMTPANQSSVMKELPCLNQPTIIVSANLNAQNISTISKRPPPPSRPVGRKPPVHPNVAPKVPPPLPPTAPVHKGPLYPNLNASHPVTLTKRPSDLALPQSSLYPKLTTSSTPGQHPLKHDATFVGSLSASLPNCNVTIPSQPILNTDKDFSSSENLSLKVEIPLREVEIQSDVEREPPKEKRFRKLNYGDLIADYSPEYLWGFALHGTRNQPNLIVNVVHELQQSTSIPVLDEQIAEAVTIIADTDKWSVKVLSSHRIHSDKLALPALNSKLVNGILEKILKLYQMSVPASFCMQQLEQSLGELVMKSKMLADYVCGNTRVKIPQLSAILGIESSDLPLLMAIASCHSPRVGAMLYNFQ